MNLKGGNIGPRLEIHFAVSQAKDIGGQRGRKYRDYPKNRGAMGKTIRWFHVGLRMKGHRGGSSAYVGFSDGLSLSGDVPECSIQTFKIGTRSVFLRAGR